MTLVQALCTFEPLRRESKCLPMLVGRVFPTSLLGIPEPLIYKSRSVLRELVAVLPVALVE